MGYGVTGTKMRVLQEHCRQVQVFREFSYLQVFSLHFRIDLLLLQEHHVVSLLCRLRPAVYGVGRQRRLVLLPRVDYERHVNVVHGGELAELLNHLEGANEDFVTR